MGAFTKTRAVADYICRHTSSDLTCHRALELLTQLRSCEAALAPKATCRSQSRACSGPWHSPSAN
jgi:hypothetical protein